jgi:hypothetical protein
MSDHANYGRVADMVNVHAPPLTPRQLEDIITRTASLADPEVHDMRIAEVNLEVIGDVHTLVAEIDRLKAELAKKSAAPTPLILNHTPRSPQ